MTKEYIIELALESEFGYCEEYIGNKSSPCRKEIVRFAALLESKVRADEREACAHMVEDWDLDLACPREVADAIRARGEK